MGTSALFGRGAEEVLLRDRSSENGGLRKNKKSKRHYVLDCDRGASGSVVCLSAGRRDEGVAASVIVWDGTTGVQESSNNIGQSGRY